MSEMPSPGSELLDALYHGDRGAVDAKLAEGPELTIFEAAAVGAVDRVHELLLLEAGFVDLWSPDGFTALHLAAFFGHEGAAEELLQRGADVSAVSRNPLRVQAIHSAAAGNHTEVVRTLLDHDADPNARQEGGYAPIHAAAQNGNDELYELLVSRGADVEVATDDGRTAADFRPQQ
ncbi:MAG: ankyrin repeat domain-containing protein [Actinomycetota bacterium]|nr:ankyrin repeat domain-containing protein [Actinomycetota bacterium]